MATRAQPMPKVPGRSERAVQEALESNRRQQADSPFSNGKLLTGISFQPTSSKDIQHGLGYMPSRCWQTVMRAGDGFFIFRSADDKKITVEYTGASVATVDLWVS